MVGGASDLLFSGRKVTDRMEFSTRFGKRGFRFSLVATPKDDCAIEDEARFYARGQTLWWELGDSDDGQSKLVAEVENNTSDAGNSQPVFDAIDSWQIYHFHDTSQSAGMRNYGIEDG